MNIKRIKLADVKPAAYNPRRQLKPGEKEYEALKASISRWSLVEPLVVNLRTGNLVGGHQRYNVLLDLGHTEAEAAVVDLDEKQEKLLNVALNRIEGQWDYEKLQDLFEEFSAEDIFATGYSDGELKTLFGGEDEDPTDLYQDDPEPEEDDDGDDTEEDDGEFSIYLSFPTRQAAEEWLEGEGIERDFPRGGRNLVIHMEGDSYEDTRYKRPEASRTLDYLDGLGFPKERRILSVQTEEDRDAYTRSGLSERVGTFLYREASTAAGNRNTILLNVPEGTNVVFMDDDIKQVVMEDLGLVPLDTLEKFERMCKLGFATAQKNRTICFGLYPVANAYFMRGGYKKAAICVGTLIGMVATPGITFCEELQTKEDYELCCRIIRKYGACIRLDRFACDVLHYSKGGCEDAWKDKSGVIRVAELLVAKYPDILKLNPKRPGEVLMVKRGKR